MKTKDFETSSGNVFADIGLPNPEEMLLKAKLTIQINDIIEERGLNQTEAAKMLKTDQAKISALSRGQLSGFSIGRLFKFLNLLGQSIDITVSAKKPTEINVKMSKPIKRINEQPLHERRPTLMAKKKSKD